MYLEPIEDLTAAQLAEYDRLVSRLLLEGDARAAANELRATPRPARHTHFSWAMGRRHHGSAI